MTLPPESEWSNLDWLTALRADSDQAWAAIRERVLRSLRAYLRGRGRALDDDLEALAEDAVQDTLLTVRAKLDTFRNDSRFTTWLHRVAVNALLGRLRQRRWNVRSPETVSDAVPDSLAIFDTREDEIVCSEFFELLPKYVDLVLATADASPLRLGQPAEALPQVAHHILQCPECAEAYEALLEIERSSR